MPSPDKKQQSSSPFPVSTDISDAKRYDFAVSPFCLCSLCISAFCESAFGLTERLANDLSYQSPPFEKDVIVTITAEPLLAKPSSNLPGGKRRSSLFRLKAAIENNAPYHVLPLRWKKYLIYIVSFAALFSPLSSNIYFPALNSIAQALHVTTAQVTLTITIYMVFQGLAPSFWGSLADAIGRRPVFIATFLVYEAANIGLACAKNLTFLMVFRAVQAVGSSATISIGSLLPDPRYTDNLANLATGAGVIADITTPDERGGLIGMFGGIRMLGQAVGPIFGGLLAQYWGFRSIFYFLFTLAAIAVLAILLYLPETLRSIAGNGTVRLRGVYRPFCRNYERLQETFECTEVEKPSQKPSWKVIFDPARMLIEKDVFVTLFFGSIVYAVWSMMTASTTDLLQDIYYISDLQVGLAFLPNGTGCVLGSIMGGKLLDRDFKVMENEYRRSHQISTDIKFDKKSLQGPLRNFDIERARIRNMWWHVVIFCGATVGYGFSLSTHLAVPLILQFFVAYTATAVFSFNSTLIIDLYPGKSASATAVNNLMRCMVGALGVGVVDILLMKLGPPITFGCLAGLTTLVSPLILVEWYWGKKWRLARNSRLMDSKM